MRLSSKATGVNLKLLTRAPGVTVPDIRTVEKRNRIGGKRYTISEAFRQFIWRTIPTIEEKIETKLLQDVYQTLDSDVLKDELVQAYRRRRMNLEEKGFHEFDQEKESPDEGGLVRPNVDVSFHDINLTSEALVGLWCMMKPHEFNEVFPKGCFGSLFNDDVSRTKIFSIQCSSEAVAIINLLKNVQKNIDKGKGFDFNRFIVEHDEDSLDFQDAMSQIKNYHNVTQVLAKDFREAMFKHRDKTFVSYKMSDSFFFDIMLHIIAKSMGSDAGFRRALAVPEIRKDIFNQLMDQILQRTQEDFADYTNPDVWLGDIGHLTFKFKPSEIGKARTIDLVAGQVEDKAFTIDLKKHFKMYEKQPEALSNDTYRNFLGINSSLMLYGDKGSGKSGVLNYVATWAWKNNFVLLKMPSAHRIMMTPTDYVRHEESRLFLQFAHAKELLDDFVMTNQKLLATIPVDMNLYGKFNITGVHESEPTAVPNTYDEWTQSNMYDSDKYYFEGEKQSNINEQRMWKLRPLIERLPNPKTLLELCSYADKDVEFSTNIFAEVIEQLQHQEQYPVLICVDDYNWMFRRSIFRSFRYDNRRMKGYVPPYHMALGRMFMRMDGHKFKNGFKLVASSNFHLYKHVFTPEKINFPTGFCQKVDGLTLDEFRYAIFNYSNSNLMTEAKIDERLIQQFYSESQGNWGILMQCINERHRSIAINTFKVDKREYLATIG